MKEPIRILHVVGSLGIGGIQSYLMSIYRCVDKTKVQFDFVVHIKSEQNYVEEVRELGGKVFYVEGDAFEKKQWRKYFVFWKKFLDEHSEYKIIHGHLRSTASLYLKLARKAGMYTIAHSHATSNGYGKTAKIKDMLQFPVRYIADYCMGCSHAANKWMFGEKRALSDTCEVLHNGIELEKYEYSELGRRKIREELGLSETDYVIGTVGRLVLQKNQKILIEAMPAILKEKRTAKLIIIGDGELRERLNELINNMGLEDKVIMLGARTDVNELLCAMDVFALPSKNEGLGIVAIEAQAIGIPTIVSCAVPTEVYISSLVSCVCGEGRVSDWAKAIVNQELKIENVKKDIIEKGYSINEIASWLCEFYFSHT